MEYRSKGLYTLMMTTPANLRTRLKASSSNIQSANRETYLGFNMNMEMMTKITFRYLISLFHHL
jgi:hypothetical protein